MQKKLEAIGTFSKGEISLLEQAARFEKEKDPTHEETFQGAKELLDKVLASQNPTFQFVEHFDVPVVQQQNPLQPKLSTEEINPLGLAPLLGIPNEVWSI